MAVIKVATSVFSMIKTVERALQKAKYGDEILITTGKYKETLTIQNKVTLTAKVAESVFIEGIIIIPKSSHVTFENITIYPTTQIYVEGHVTLQNCIIDGSLSNVLLSINGGTAKVEKSRFIGATDIAVALIKGSDAQFNDCYFECNEKSHILVENSTIQLKNCELLKSQHAIWIKSNSNANLENVKIHHHSGTQVIVQDGSALNANGCSIEHGEGNGIYASEQANIQMNSTVIQHHALPQLWIQNSQLQLVNCQIQHGNESGIVLREFSEATISNSLFSYHKIANVQLILESLLNITDSQIYSCQGVGIQVKEKSIANFINTIFADNVLPQLFISEKSICTLKDTTIKDGKQVGIFAEKGSSCSLVSSSITNQQNTAVTVIDAEVFLMDTIIKQNKGNGVLTVNHASATIENCHFNKNDMPHIAGKNHSNVTVLNSEFIGGKSIFLIEKCELDVKESTFKDGTGVQIEVGGQTKATIHKSRISGGQSNGIKAMKDATLHITESQVMAHKMPQIIVNDSSLIFKNSELLHGNRNGLIIENHSEAFIQDSFISSHLYPQIWIDLESSVELSASQLTEGHESDIYVQNNSVLHASNCIIQNDKFNFNIQAVNFSKINLIQTTVKNSVGDKFYSENNSHITHSLDEGN